jgi:hypothetical protein
MNPFRSLKFLPWQALFVVAIVAIALVTVVDVLLIVAASYSAVLAQTLRLLLAPGVSIFVLIGVNVIIGTLAVWLLEIMYPRVVITVGVLWALLACLIVVQFVAGFFQVPSLFVTPGEFSLIGMLLGIFLVRGKHYWRY